MKGKKIIGDDAVLLMTVEEEMKLAEDDKGTARGETRVEP